MNGDRIFSIILLLAGLVILQDNDRSIGNSMLPMYLAWQANSLWNRNEKWFFTHWEKI